ncbi:hypothetical protein GOBAR_AA03076 [Gossypium barbadense]|uniref:Chloride conductance regulatory protein ICln n=1 Tax=Gossypium barbadense TaxID=3634 RepID=A0A2P5YPJ6_GOSBA|nr:hypothetical protein GOBAR_AA03076 [Gossypium barbadense]
MAVGLRHFTARAGNGVGEPILDTDNGEELVHIQPSVSVAVGNRASESLGTLYITTGQVIWLSELDREKGYAVDFLSLSLHAVSRDPEAYPSPCIYTQIREMRFIPSDANQGEEEGHNWIFSADQLEDEAGGDDVEWHFSQNPTNTIGHSNGHHDLASSVLEICSVKVDTLFQVFCECAELNPEPIELQINDQRFEDAEEMEQDADTGHHHQSQQ